MFLSLLSGAVVALALAVGVALAVIGYRSQSTAHLAPAARVSNPDAAPKN